MARPRIDDALLKHPRRIRRSPVVGPVLEGVPTPSSVEINRWKPLVAACTRLIILNNRLDNVEKKAKIRLWLPTRWSITSELPPCRCAGNNKLTTINAELPLLWLYQHRLCSHNPSMLYAELREFNSRVRKLEIDKMILGVYDGCFEIDIGE